MMSANPIVRLDLSHFAYEAERPVLGQVQMAISPGEIVGISGASGCGKTTLLRIMAGALATASGVVERRVPASCLAYSPQDDVLLEYRTVFENAWLLRERQQQPAFNANGGREVGEVLDALRLGSSADRLPGELSGGMRQRTQFAQLLVAGAALMLLDEPFSQQDRGNQFAMEGLLFEAVKRSGDTAALIVSHDLDSLGTICDRTILFGGSPAVIVAEVVLPEALGILSPENRRLDPDFGAFNQTLWAARAEAALQ